jgi:SAM-dependent methyltransferase
VGVEGLSLSLASFQHRSSYRSLPAGRDRYNVRAIGPWLEGRLLEALAAGPGPVAVLDVGCGEQPFRPLIEGTGARYVGMDIVQNATGSVDVLGGIDDSLPCPWPGRQPPYPVVLCSEVLEHVRNWPRSFSNLRALLAPGGRLILTVPFLFPLHMEPYDYLRATPHALADLARGHGFAVERCDRLGDPLDVACTILDDLSILPARRNFFCQAKVQLIRMCRRLLVRLLDSTWFRLGMIVNSNGYLSNALVLRGV